PGIIIDCLSNFKTSNSEEKDILKKILKDFSNKDFSLLSSQEKSFLSTHPIEQWPEYLIFRYKFLNYPNQKIVSNFPIYLLIEPVSSCNLRCTMCFQIDDSFSKSNEYMGIIELDLFKKIIDEAEKSGTKAITLASRGEPTLHPHLDKMLEYCKNKFLELKLNTNAIKLNEKLCHTILKSNVTDIVFSVDSYEKKSYESIRVGGNFEILLKNIKKFHEIRDNFYPNSKCATRISGVKVDQKMNSNEFKKFWQKIVDHVAMVDLQYRWDTYHNPTSVASNDPCRYLWERMYIWYDGTANPCDTDYKSELSTGSIKNNTISEIWNGDKYASLRNSHTGGERSKCYPCDRCPNGS
ncbi:radical SAM protein, partial [Nitrosopumilus sp.]|nr:radical SAM protein [Nitrosopumilus sp.]